MRLMKTQVIEKTGQIVHHYYDDEKRYLGPWIHAADAPCVDCKTNKGQKSRRPILNHVCEVMK